MKITAVKSYVLVTPVKDEEGTILETIRAVKHQTVLPVEWIVVSDGSTDNTDKYVQEACKRQPWIRLIQLPPREERDFAAVVNATQRGVSEISVAYEYIGLLDADVRFQNDYFEIMIKRFEANPLLGLAGGVVVDLGSPKVPPKNRWDVPGAVQFFKRECFESLDGLLAIPEGGWDALTCAKARMEGYETELVTALIVDHLKPRNLHVGKPLLRVWNYGVRDCALGNHPLFQLMKCMGRFHEKPPIISPLIWWLGYCFAMTGRRNRGIPYELQQFVREEQLRRVRSVILGPRFNKASKN